MQPVLFKDDILKWESATYHIETKNLSFIHYCNVLKKMGVANHAFPLTLLDPDLALVDPREPADKYIADKVAIECSLNPWYVLREIIRTPEDGSYLRANRGMISLVWLFYNRISTIQTQPRQSGKTLGLNSLFIILSEFVYENTTINALTLNEKLRDETVEKLKKMMAYLPPYLNFRTSKDTDVNEHVKIKAKNNTIRFWLPRSDEINARNVCRGSSGGALLGDEPPFQANFAISWPAAQNSCNAEFERLEKLGLPNGEVILTTAAVSNTKSGAFVYKLIENSAVFSEFLYDAKDREELVNIIERRSNGSLRVYAEFNALQLGIDEERFKKNVRNNTGNKAQIAMELFNVWQNGEEDSALTLAERERAVRGTHDPKYVEVDEKTSFSFNWYIEKENIDNYLQTESFVMSLDMAEGRGGDDIALTLVNTATAEVVGEGDINIVNTFLFCVYIGKWFSRIPNMVFIPEAKSLGISTVDYLLDFLPTINEDPHRRIFNWVVNDKGNTHKDDERYYQLAKGARSTKELKIFQKDFGYATSANGRASRDNLYNQTLRDFMRVAIDRINSKKLANQLVSLRTKNGRIDHTSDLGDDKVIGWLLCGWFLHYAKNKTLYKLDPSKIMSDVNLRSDKALSDDEIYAKARNKVTLELINEKLEQLEKVTDHFEGIRIENEIRHLERKLDLSVMDNEPISIEEMIDDIYRARNTEDIKEQDDYINPAFDPYRFF